MPPNVSRLRGNVMLNRLKILLPLLLLMAVPGFAEEYIDHYVGRDGEGNKKYFKWSVSDNIAVSVGYSPADEVSKVLYSCLEKYRALAWSSAKVHTVEIDNEAGEVFIKVKLQYIFNHTFLLATLKRDGTLTCHGINDDD